jgi:predicted metal-dependent peptidase
MTSALTDTTLTADQERKWEESRVALQWSCPAFAYVFYNMMVKKGSKHLAVMTKDVPIAATDDASLIINPDTFFKYPLQKRVFIQAHEIMHSIFGHCGMMHKWASRGRVDYPDGTSLPYIHEVMNISMDYVINAQLIDGKVGEFAQGEWLYDPQLVTANDSVVDVYKKIFRDEKARGNIKQGKCLQAPGSGKGFDEHLEPGTSQGKDPATAASERNQAAWDTAITAGAAHAKAMGKLPAGLERLFQELLSPAVDWKDKIAALFARKLGAGSYDWRRPDRRLITRDIYAPARSGYGAGDVVVAVDTSGSVGTKELNMFMAEIAGILADVQPKRLIIMWCDANIGRVDECEDENDLNTLRCKGVPGGGGTSFVPVFEEIEKMNITPDALVYLTDGMGTFPRTAPKYPVIWGNIYPASKYPFGDVVDIPKQAA